MYERGWDRVELARSNVKRHQRGRHKENHLHREGTDVGGVAPYQIFSNVITMYMFTINIVLSIKFQNYTQKQL